MFKYKHLFFSKAFFGSSIRNWNPQNQPFIHGCRFRVHILDLVSTNFHLRKFFLILRIASQNRLTTCFVLRPHFSPIYSNFVPFASYAPYWVGGILSNFKSIRYHFSAAGVISYLPRFPDLAIFLNDLTRMDYMINEGFNTRTPFLFFGDSSTNLQQSIYGVGGKIFDLATATFITNVALKLIKRGVSRSKISFKESLEIRIKENLALRKLPLNFYTSYVQFKKQKYSYMTKKFVHFMLTDSLNLNLNSPAKKKNWYYHMQGEQVVHHMMNLLVLLHNDIRNILSNFPIELKDEATMHGYKQYYEVINQIIELQQFCEIIKEIINILLEEQKVDITKSEENADSSEMGTEIK